MNRISSLVVALACFLYTTTSASEQSAAEFFAARERQNFGGWDGVVLYCVYEKSIETIAAPICARAKVDFEFLAATAKVEAYALIAHQVSREVGPIIERIGRDELFTLELSVTATKGAASGVWDIRAVYAELAAKTAYDAAVEVNRTWQRSRNGDLIMWSRDVIASGVASEMTESLAPAIETLLKQFFAHYLKHSDNGAE